MINKFWFSQLPYFYKLYCYTCVAYICVALLTLLVLGCGGEDPPSNEDSSHNSKKKKLQRIDIVAYPIITYGVSSLTLAKGNQQPFIAMGHYADGSARDITNIVSWSSSNENRATFTSTGLLKGVSIGMVGVSARKDSITSNAIYIEITDAAITVIQVTPAIMSVVKGQTHQLTAIALYSDSTTADVTNSVVWWSDNESIAIITQAGLLSGTEVGIASITASKDGIISNLVTAEVIEVRDAVARNHPATNAVAPPPGAQAENALITAIIITPGKSDINNRVSITQGQNKQFKATATYSNATRVDMTELVTWLSDDPDIVTVTRMGVLRGVRTGKASVTASKDGITSNVMDVNIESAVVNMY